MALYPQGANPHISVLMAASRSKTTAKAREAESPKPVATRSGAVVSGTPRDVAPGEVRQVALEPMQPPRSRRARRILLAALALVAAVSGGRFAYDWFVRGQFIVSTDDAYIRSDLSIISPKVTGYAAAILVAENAHVKAGDLLVAIDPADYRLAVEAAKGKIATQDAIVARIGKQVEAQSAAVSRAAAQLAAARADLAHAESELERTRELVRRAVSSQKLLDSAKAAHARALAGVASAQAAVRAARAQRDVLEAQRAEALSARSELVTALRKAQRDLEATRIRAPFDGVVGNLAVKPGQLVEPGTRLLALVPLNSVYVEANFKETQIARLKPGQPVEISVDAFSSTAVRGRVSSIAPAAGQEFSLLPPQNATGNFTKIVQRVPVRISIPAEIAAQGRLRPGLSVVARVDTRDPDAPPPSLLELVGWPYSGGR
ncbi:MAG: HlyD family secretion protein [Methyloligellaceae bacterium]